MGLLKSLFNEVKKQAIEDAHKPSRKQLNDEKVAKFIRENRNIKGVARKMAEEKGVSLETLLEKAKKNIKK